jgi:nucleoside-triphosphatase
MGIKVQIAVTGRPGVGKTTLLQHLVDRIPLASGGMITREIRKCGRRVGFAIIDIATHTEGTLAHLHQQEGRRIGQYRVNLHDLEQVGIAAIYRAIHESDVVVIDEIAPMELCSPCFIPAVEAALASSKSLLISIHPHVDHPLAHRIRQQFELFRVKISNRDTLVQTIGQRFI